MRNRLSFLSLALVVMAAVALFGKKSPETLKEKPRTVKKSVPLPAVAKYSQADIEAARTPSEDRPSVPIRQLNVSKQKFRAPASIAPAPAMDPTIYQGLGNLRVAPELRAVRTRDYSPALGEAQFASSGTTTFKPAGPVDESHANVVYDPANKRFYALTSVLRIRDIKADSRNDVLADGYQEYYYAPRTNLLFLSSSHQTLFRDYRALKAKGYDVSLEVLRAEYKSR